MCVCVCRYRAVASRTRVRSVGVPVLTALEIVFIWCVSAVLAVPEAMGFRMVAFSYRNTSTHVCMLQPTTPFLRVSIRKHTHTHTHTQVRDPPPRVFPADKLFWRQRMLTYIYINLV